MYRMEAGLFDMVLGNAIIYEGLMQMILPRLEATHAEFTRQRTRHHGLRRIAASLGAPRLKVKANPGLLQPTGTCRICEIGEQTSQHYAMVLVEMLAIDRYQQLYAQSDGVCISHLRLMLALGDVEEGIEYTLCQTQSRLQKLRSDLDRLRESYRYENHGEVLSEDERKSVERAIAFLNGTAHSALEDNGPN